MTAQAHKLAPLFGASVFRGLSRPCAPEEVRGIINSAGMPGLGRRMRLRLLFDRAYDQLLESYRCEYVFKNAITNNILLKNHSLTATGPDGARMLTEFWVDDVRADLAVINGTSSVYEVKTSLDTLNRLAQQVAGYSRLFDRIHVVTVDSMAEAVLQQVPAHVGVMVLDPQGELLQRRAASSNKAQADVALIFRSMRALEVLQICREMSGQPLDVPNGRRAQVCWEIFKTLSPDQAHDAMVKALRGRQIHAAHLDLIDAVPQSLKHLSVAKAMNVAQYRSIRTRLDAVA